ncbi:hypothetical protein [Methylobacterium thuringiense]|uniref:Uncharacterized protein n=1 Tax=Methylobacterium thuringiense TaxID=1003091 RepID=A0ABQ4TKE8_9HYPH|nr:hypothetical protein [Methylobacterium thuringiense]GJE55756.1 hypothetical protein EKPJFOCH_2251 [Methylobacterium thuringiense]
MLDEDDESEVDLEVSWYDYHIYSQSNVLKDLVSSVILIVDAKISSHCIRQRKHRKGVRKSFLASIDSIVSNLAYVFVQRQISTPIVVSRKTSDKPEHKNIYLPTKTFISCLDLLEECGILTQTVGAFRGQRTTITATASFVESLLAANLNPTSFRECDSRPLVVLKRSKKNRPGKKRTKEPVSIKGNPEVAQMAAQVDRINNFLRSADIAFLSDGLIPVVFDSRRTLVRFFTIRDAQEPRFDQGGRLFGGFWQALKSDRRGNIRIDGEPVADLDFKNLGPRLAYALSGHEAPGDDEDLYDVCGLLPGYQHHYPDHRPAIKQALASLFNGGQAGSREILDKLPKGTTAEAVRVALWIKHPALEALCDGRPVPIGFTIMFTESRILLCTLEKLMALGVVALPFHDGLMCAASKREIVREALREASEEIVRVRLPVVSKADYGQPEATEGLLAA